MIERVFAASRASSQRKKARGLCRFAERECEILKSFEQGLSSGKIADPSGNQPLTLRNAVYSFQNKLGIETQPEFVDWAVRNGSVDGQRGSNSHLGPNCPIPLNK